MFRHEYKYFSPEYTLQALEHRVGAVMHRDSHVGEQGFYAIRSLYFDDMYNTCYHENENGTDPREKFRIRIYNCSQERITLELKQKQRGKTFKQSCPLSLSRCRTIMTGGIPDVQDSDCFLYKKLWTQLHVRQLHPVVIVSYERVPYIWKDGNVRVTFDRNIRSSSNISAFFDETMPSRSVLPSGTNLLEVKFDAFLPDFLYEILQTGTLRETAFSKYFLCRKYALPGGVRRIYDYI